MHPHDFLHIDFIGRISGTNELFDTTVEEVAKQEGISNEKIAYGPVLVVLGERMIVPGVEKALETMHVGEEKEVDLQPEEGFGKRDASLIKVIPMNKFIQQKINPVPGAFVTIDGMSAKIQSVSAGRVRIDFNHPLAGRPLHYWIRLVKKIEKPLEKAQELLTYFGAQAKTTLTGDLLTIETQKEAQPVVKKFFDEKIRRLIPDVKTIEFVSLETAKKEKAENMPAEETMQ